MSVINLVSGGIDSSLISILLMEEKINFFPLFIDYGQRAAKKEWESCLFIHKKHDLPPPEKMDIRGYGTLINSGLTNRSQDIIQNAFTPCRNLIFLTMAAAYAVKKNSSFITIGLLNEKFSLFPDQKKEFLTSAENTIQLALDCKIKMLAPLFNFSKSDVIILAKEKNLTNTYSCHMGTAIPCGCCISCQEIINTQQ